MLRRDHHCSFGAVCVGHFNQRLVFQFACMFTVICRYFVAAAISLFALTVPLVGYDWNLLNMQLDGGVTFGNLWQVMIPHLAWISGFITIWQFFHILIFVLTFTVALYAFYLVGAQVFVIYKGQTRVEYLLVSRQIISAI